MSRPFLCPEVVTLSESLLLEEYTQRFRDKDRFLKLCEQCPRFSLWWSCPDSQYDFDYSLSGFTFITIFATRVESDANFKAVRRELDEQMLALESKYKNSRAFFAGSCTWCESCMKPEPCIKPEKMRYSLEALGYDLTQTVSELFGIEIKWDNGEQRAEYYTLVSALCSHEKLDL